MNYQREKPSAHIFPIVHRIFMKHWCADF